MFNLFSLNSLVKETALGIRSTPTSVSRGGSSEDSATESANGVFTAAAGCSSQIAGTSPLAGTSKEPPTATKEENML